MTYRTLTVLSTLLILDCLPLQIVAEDKLSDVKLVEARRIWDRAPHNAFTDLIRFQDRWFCVFREGQAHVSPDGSLRVITSVDGEHWESAALITSDRSDLRDAKITITPSGQLMLAGAETVHQPTTHKHQSLVWFSDDGFSWSQPFEVGDKNNWLWRITWNKQAAYGFGYNTGNQPHGIRLFQSDDGKHFEHVIGTVDVPGTYPNESSLLFLPDGTGYCLLRQDGEPKSGFLGTAQPPYTKWSWQTLGVRIGGPDMIQIPDGRIVAVVRLYDGKPRTAVCWLDPQRGTLTEGFALPSGGDTSYAGLAWHEDKLWISYYSSHEGQTSIYLAKVQFHFNGHE